MRAHRPAQTVAGNMRGARAPACHHAFRREHQNGEVVERVDQGAKLFVRELVEQSVGGFELLGRRQLTAFRRGLTFQRPNGAFSCFSRVSSVLPPTRAPCKRSGLLRAEFPPSSLSFSGRRMRTAIPRKVPARPAVCRRGGRTCLTGSKCGARILRGSS